MRRHFHAILILAVTVAFFLPALGGMQGLVLCLSSSRHIAIEASHAPPSCALLCEDGARSLNFATDQPTPRCGCTDIALPSLDLLTYRVRSAVPALPQATSSVAVIDSRSLERLIDCGRSTAAFGGQSASDGAPPGLIALRTIVLHI